MPLQNSVQGVSGVQKDHTLLPEVRGHRSAAPYLCLLGQSCHLFPGSPECKPGSLIPEHGLALCSTDAHLVASLI